MKGVLLVNLGSPESPTPKDVKPYLDEFLMDKYVIDVPFLLRALLVRGIILQTRPKKSAEAYARIWTSEGSPLIVISKKMHQKVQKLVDIPVALAMRYGTMTIQKGLQENAIKPYRIDLIGGFLYQDIIAVMNILKLEVDPARQQEAIDIGFEIFWNGIKES